MFAKRQQQSHD